jgi:hypothetical protein
MPARPDVADDVLRLAFIAASSPPLFCSPLGKLTPRARDALRRALPPASHDPAYLDLLVFAALAAELLVVSHNRLALAPPAAAWAAAPPADQLRTLRFATLAHPDAAARWAAARRPGFRLLRNLPPFAQLLPPERAFSHSAVARRIGMLSSNLLLSDSPASSITALVDALVFAHRTLSPLSRRRPRSSLSVHLSFEGRPGRGASFFSTTTAFPPPPAFLELAALASLSTPDALTIDDASLRRALASGLSARAVLAALDRCLPSLARPPAFDVAVRRIARRHGRIHLHQVTLLETRSAADLDAILVARRARRAVLRTLSPRTVVVDPRFLPDLRRRLRTIPEFIDDTPPSDDALLDDALHLYLAARIAHALPDLVPIPWRLPHALVARLERALSPAQRALAAASLEAWRTSLAEPALPAAWFSLDAPRLADLDEPSRSLTTLCAAAAHDGAALSFEYQGRDDALASHRSVEALRIEWRRGIPYLVAFDLDAEEERTFRIDRMRALARLTR